MKQQYHVSRPPLPPGVELEENIYITMRDGIKLAVDVYKPEKKGRYPAIMTLAPYRKEGMVGNPVEGYHSEGGNPALYIPHGYVMVCAQVRGSGMSQGQYNFYDAKEQSDGYDLVEGIAEQPWCDGNVGMIGGSYLGKSQFYTAAQQPPHLKCIVPYEAGDDLYRDWAYQGGGCYMGPQFINRWAANVMSDCFHPGPVEGKLPPMNMIAEFLIHYLDGPWWWERSPFYLTDKIKCPVLQIVSSSGWLHSRAQLIMYTKIKSTQKLVVSPNNMKRTPSSYPAIFWENKPINDYILRWFDYWLKGIDTGIMDEPPVVIFDDGKDEWRYENEYPLERTKWTKFYLHSNPENPSKPPQGLISVDKPAINEKPDIYKSFGYRGPATPMNKPVLAYATPPLEEDLKLVGPVSVTLFASSKIEDTRTLAWFVKLGDVDPDGVITIITKGNLKASFREVDETKSKTGQPFHPFQKQEYVESGEIYEYQIEVIPIFHTFKAGHKIWLQIASDDPGFVLANSADAQGGPVPAENSIYHDRAHPSRLLMPVIPDAPIVAPIKNPMWEPKLTKFCHYPGFTV
ncbi:CocE/NonD family hydrolase [Chloroflexota bacterium]